MKKSIALFCYGQFRSYEKNLEKNLKQLDFIISKNDIHVFILSDKLINGNYSKENEEKIISIFNKYKCIVHFIKYVEDIKEYDKNKEDLIDYTYNNKTITGKGASPFVSKLIHRKYLINILKNNYIENNNIHIDLHFYCRIFDVIIVKNNKEDFINYNFNKLYKNSDLILGSNDHIYIGHKESIDFLFNLGKDFAINIIYDDNMWNNNDFTDFYISIDYCLGILQHTYSPETQYAYHIFISKYKYQNIRFDYNNPLNILNQNTLFHIFHDSNRFIKK